MIPCQQMKWKMVAIMAVLGCFLLAIVLVWLYPYRISQKTRDREKTSLRKKFFQRIQSELKLQTSTKPLLNETSPEQP